MKRIGIHQINYFPWTGYFNKMAKSDLFVYLDEVQLADRGFSQRAPMINSNGKETYLNVSVEKHGHRDKKFHEIILNNEANWQDTQYNFLKGNYSKHPYYAEVMERIEDLFTAKYERLIDINLKSIDLVREILGIRTETVMQSDLDYDRTSKKNDLMLELTKSCSGDVYLSGNGARKYMILQEFEDQGVKVQYLTFSPFSYPQYKSNDFNPGLSTLDLLFNVGLQESRDLFWENIQENEVIEIVQTER